MRRFVPAADEVHRLQTGKDVECRIFQRFCEEGHYKGRVRPSTTRQGIYAAAPNGTFLASCNTRHANTVEKMLRRALKRWNELKGDQRLLTAEDLAKLEQIKRWSDRYPEGGLVLRITTRDLPRADKGRGWKATAWNLDYAWFKKKEARRFLPAQPVADAQHEIPRALVARLVRLHLLDSVRGQVPPFREQDVATARLATTVVEVADDRIKLRLEGETRASRKGEWAVNGFRDRRNKTAQERGFTTKLLGYATFDTKAARFTAFEMVAIGKRWGGTQFNGRNGDLAPSAVGVVLALSSGEPGERVPPARIWNYGGW